MVSKSRKENIRKQKANVSELKEFRLSPSIDVGDFETKINNLFVGGDGAGIPRGLAQAGANGVKVARSIIKRV